MRFRKNVKTDTSNNRGAAGLCCSLLVLVHTTPDRGFRSTSKRYYTGAVVSGCGTSKGTCPHADGEDDDGRHCIRAIHTYDYGTRIQHVADGMEEQQYDTKCTRRCTEDGKGNDAPMTMTWCHQCGWTAGMRSMPCTVRDVQCCARAHCARTRSIQQRQVSSEEWCCSTRCPCSYLAICPFGLALICERAVGVAEVE